MISDLEEWLAQRYIVDIASKQEMADELGCSIHNISRLVKKHGLKRGRAIQKGKPAWNSGLTKNTDERLAKVSEKMTGGLNPMFGKPSWNGGLTKVDDGRLENISRKLVGRKHSAETIEKLRNAKLGLRGQEASNYKRGWWLNAAGYVEIKNELGEKVYLHRHLAEVSLERKLKRGEHVHHLDGDKQNNEPKNLIVILLKVHTLLHRHCFPASADMQMKWIETMGFKFERVEIR